MTDQELIQRVVKRAGKFIKTEMDDAFHKALVDRLKKWLSSLASVGTARKVVEDRLVTSVKKTVGPNFRVSGLSMGGGVSVAWTVGFEIPEEHKLSPQEDIRGYTSTVRELELDWLKAVQFPSALKDAEHSNRWADARLFGVEKGFRGLVTCSVGYDFDYRDLKFRAQLPDGSWLNDV